jgi:hypothetical protein
MKVHRFTRCQWKKPCKEQYGLIDILSIPSLGGSISILQGTFPRLLRSFTTALAGVDLSAVAIGQARERAEAWGLSERATFQVGEAAATGLASPSLDGMMSVDAY